VETGTTSTISIYLKYNSIQTVESAMDLVPSKGEEIQCLAEIVLKNKECALNAMVKESILRMASPVISAKEESGEAREKAKEAAPAVALVMTENGEEVVDKASTKGVMEASKASTKEVSKVLVVKVDTEVAKDLVASSNGD
jgi:hypothetical protein